MIKIQTLAPGVNTNLNSSGLTNYSIIIIEDPIRELNYLDECSQKSTVFSSPLTFNSSLINITRINIYYQKGIDITNISIPFFTDRCIPYFDENGNYLTIKMRISFFPNFSNFCSNDCIFEGFNSLNYSMCNCLNQTGGFSSMTQSITSSLVGSNIFTITCIKTAFSTSGFFENIGNYVTFILIFLCAFSLSFFKKRNMYLIDLYHLELIRCDGHFVSNEKVSLEEFVNTYKVLPSAKVVVDKSGKQTFKKIEVHDFKGKQHLIKDPNIKKLFKKLQKQKKIEDNLLTQAQNNLDIIEPQRIEVNNINSENENISDKIPVHEEKKENKDINIERILKVVNILKRKKNKSNNNADKMIIDLKKSILNENEIFDQIYKKAKKMLKNNSSEEKVEKLETSEKNESLEKIE